MEFNEEELENVKAGYSANDNLENLAEMLYNKALIRNETMGKGTMTMPIIYTTSGGDPGKVKKGKDTIIYGIVGLIIAILAFVIVNFVINVVTPT